jgi:hypothetical protein
VYDREHGVAPEDTLRARADQDTHPHPGSTEQAGPDHSTTSKAHPEETH